MLCNIFVCLITASVSCIDVRNVNVDANSVDLCVPTLSDRLALKKGVLRGVLEGR